MKNFILFLASLTLLSACNSSDNRRWISSQGAIWNTLYKVTYHAGGDLSDSIVTTLHDVEMSLSPFQHKSLISRINRGETDSADHHLTRIFLASQRISALSGGMFDPTVAPLVNYWGFGYDSVTTTPDSIMDLVGIRDCRLTDTGIQKKHPHTEFNFSAITKGYGCDAVGDMLRRNGCDDFLVEIGGEISVSGHSPHGRPWRIMVDAPHESNDRIVHDEMMTISATDCGIATSGNYRNYRLTDIGKLSHTISPVTGRPVTLDTQDSDSTVLSATVIANTAMEADALATASMLMSPSAAEAMARTAGASRLILAVSTATDSLLILDSCFQ